MPSSSPRHCSARASSSSPEALLVEAEVLGEGLGGEELEPLPGQRSDGCSVDFHSVAKPLVREVEEGEPAALAGEAGHFLPLLGRQVGPGGVVAAGVQDDDIAGGNALERFEQGVRAQLHGAGVEVGVGLDGEAGGLEDALVVGPGRVAEPDGRLGEVAGGEVGGQAEGGGAARGLEGGDAAVERAAEVVAEAEGLGGLDEPGFAVDGQVAFGFLGLGEPGLGLAHGGRSGGLAGVVDEDAHAEVDLPGIFVGLEGLGQA